MQTIVLDNAMIWVGDGNSLAGHVIVADGKIQDVALGRYGGPLPATDLGGAALSPGLIDLMVLGGFDRSILRDDPLEILREYVRLGVTSCQVCSGTLAWESMKNVAANVLRAMQYKGHDAASMLGYYLEGPFQHPDHTGASLREHALPPSPDNVRRVLDELGEPLRMINVSPDTEGDVAAIRAFCAAGKVVSMAHSKATAERIDACLAAGTSVLGHVWDNNSGLLGDSGVQQPTLEHVSLVDERIKAIHMICDGAHVHPVLVRLVVRCRGVESVCLVTDCVPRAGCPDGPYLWDDGRSFYKKGGVGRTDKHGLTGSALLLPDHFRNFVRFTGAPPAKAIRTVTYNPAASIGLEKQIGLVAPGRVADLVAWDDQLQVRRVWRRGKELSNVSDYAEVHL